MPLLDNIKSHIQANRGKYGTAAGIGAGVAATKMIDPNTLSNGVDQALYNTGVYGARGINAVGNAVGIPTLSNGLPNVSQAEQDAVNKFYNYNLPEQIRPEVGTLLNASKEYINESESWGDSGESKLMDKIVEILNESVNINSTSNRNKFFRRAVKLTPEYSQGKNAGFIGGGVGSVVGAGLGSTLPVSEINTDDGVPSVDESNVPEAVGAVLGGIVGASKMNNPKVKQAMGNLKTDLVSAKILNRVTGNSTEPLSNQDRNKVFTAARIVAAKKAADAARKRALDAQPNPVIIPPVQIAQ